jgi:hypothetical protein
MDQDYLVNVEVAGEMVLVGRISPQTRHTKVPNLWVSSANAMPPPGSPGWPKKVPFSWLAPIDTSDEDIARWLAAGWGLYADPPPGSPGFATLGQIGLFTTPTETA